MYHTYPCNMLWTSTIFNWDSNNVPSDLDWPSVDRWPTPCNGGDCGSSGWCPWRGQASTWLVVSTQTGRSSGRHRQRRQRGSNVAEESHQQPFRWGGLSSEPQARTRPRHPGLPVHCGLPGSCWPGHCGDPRRNCAGSDPGLRGSGG